MNILTQFIGLAFNLINVPFVANDVNLNPIAAAKTILRNPLHFPVNVLQATGLPTCNAFILKLGDNELKFSVLPRGICNNCCEVRANQHVRFLLYTKAKPSPTRIHPYNAKGAAKKAGINATAPTIIFIHGFTEPSPGDSGKAIVEAYLSRPEHYNVILLDWSQLATFPWYKTAVQNVKLTGLFLKQFIEIFNDSGEMPLRNLHVVGFSLGCHIASQAGKQLRRGLKLPRITALDPAFPEFSIQDTARRLTPNDAEYIDAIHTDAGVFGVPFPVGHADFYPNGGAALQPGCQPSLLAQLRLADQVLGCSHIRAWKLFAESVRNPKAFPSTKCKVWKGPNKQCEFSMDSYMGHSNDRKKRGQFYLITNHVHPFGRNVAQQIL